MSKILVVTAMPQEATPDLYKVYGVDYLCTGIGTRSTAISLTKALLSGGYDYIVNLGYVGSSSPLEVTEPVIVTQSYYRDYDLDIYGKPQRFDLFVPENVSFLREVSCYTGDGFYTGGSYKISSSVKSELPPVYDMELASICQTVSDLGLPTRVVSLKVVSDLSDKLQYQKLDIDALTAILGDLASRTLDELTRN